MRSNPALKVFLFSNSKIFYDLITILDILRSFDRFKVLIKVIISEFYMAWSKNLENFQNFLPAQYFLSVTKEAE